MPRKIVKSPTKTKEKPQSKADFIELVSVKMGSSKKEAEACISAVLDSLQETLAKGLDQIFMGFGTFSVKDRPARIGRNPGRGESMTIEAKRVVVFKAGSSLKQVITI